MTTITKITIPCTDDTMGDTSPKVAYHTGGLMFAGDEKEYPEGWYLFTPGVGATPVIVLEPGTNEPMKMED